MLNDFQISQKCHLGCKKFMEGHASWVIALVLFSLEVFSTCLWHTFPSQMCSLGLSGSSHFMVPDLFMSPHLSKHLISSSYFRY
jgi:hypothetical protein